MKTLSVLLGAICFYVASLMADSVILFSTTTNNCLRFFPSVDPSTYVARVDAMIFNDLTTQTETEMRVVLSTTPVIYTKKIGNPQITYMTQTERDQVDSEARALSISKARTLALSELVSIGSSYARDRGIVLLTKDEINVLRQWITAFKVEVSSSTSLSDFRNRVSNLPNMPDRTAAQAKTALQNIITSGQADE